MIGVDLENNSRFEHYSEQGLTRIFTEAELKYAREFENWQEHLTGFFCVKEAFVKVVDEDIDYLQIEVLHKETGKPYINLTPYLKRIFRQKAVQDVDVSISHCKQFSTAVVELVCFAD